MDGNRRWARPKGYRPSRGHAEGFSALKGLLEFLMDLNVHQVTVYAFAVDNFKRPEEEVASLMHLAQTELLALAQHGELLQKYGVRVNIVGRRDLLPEAVKEACAQVEDLTKAHTKAIFNVCVPYSSQDEMAHAFQVCAAQDPSSKPTLENQLYTSLNPHWTAPDLLIRTSGVSRLSDFLLWQANERTSIHVLPCYWPDIGVADVVPVLLAWQAAQLLSL